MTSRTSKQQQRARLRENTPPAQAMGFVNDDGDVCAVRGDDQYAYMMVPKDLLVPQTYRPYNADAPLTEFSGFEQATVLSEIDVRDARTLTFFIRFFPGFDETVGAVSTLAIIPEVSVPLEGFARVAETTSATRDENWFPIGVIDPFLRGTAPAISGYTSIAPPSVAYRDVYAAQLNFYGVVSNVDPQPAYIPQYVVPFDVTPYALFRLRIGVVNPEISATTPPYTYVTPANANVDLKYLASR